MHQREKEVPKYYSTHIYKRNLRTSLRSLLMALRKVLQRFVENTKVLRCNKCPGYIGVIRSTSLYLHHKRSSGQKEVKFTMLLKFSQQWGSCNISKHLRKYKAPVTVYCKEDPLLIQWIEAEKEGCDKQGACLLPNIYKCWYHFLFICVLCCVSLNCID